jgi:hypothetical protein
MSPISYRCNCYTKRVKQIMYPRSALEVDFRRQFGEYTCAQGARSVLGTNLAIAGAFIVVSDFYASSANLLSPYYTIVGRLGSMMP